MKQIEDPWGGQNPLGCCRDHVTEGGVPVHGGPDCIWPGSNSEPKPPMPTYTASEIIRALLKEWVKQP